MTPRPPPPRLLAALALPLLLAPLGCANTKIKYDWKDPSLREGRYRKVMVLAALPNFARRQTVEDRIVAELSREGVEAVRSWDLLPEEALTDRERVAQVVAASQADALITLRVVSRSTDEQVVMGREEWVAQGVSFDYYGYLTTSVGLYRKPEVYEILTVSADTALWDVASRRMLWACRSDSVTAKDTITTAELADDYAQVVMKRARPYLRGR